MIFKRNNEHFSAQETPGEKLRTDLQLEKARLLCCFRQAKLWLQYLYTFTYFIINKSKMIFKRNNEHFRAQETPREKHPTDLQLEKAKLLCCFRQVKQWLRYLYTFTYFIINKSKMIFKRNNEHFRAQETTGEKLPTDLRLEKAKLLCCFRQAKQWL